MDDFEPLTLKTLGEKVTAALIMIGVALVLLVVVIVAAALGAAVAFGMPVLSQDGCAIVADASLVGRALEIHQIDRAKALPILTQIYDEGLHPYLGEILDATHRDGETRSAREFSRALLASCLANRGDLTRFLGAPA